MVINGILSNKFGNILNITHPQDKYKRKELTPKPRQNPKFRKLNIS